MLFSLSTPRLGAEDPTPVEGFATLLTLVGPCSSMNDMVLGEDGAVFKGFATVFTFVGQMTIRSRIINKSFAMFFMSQWLLSTMRTLTDCTFCMIKGFCGVITVTQIFWGEKKTYNFNCGEWRGSVCCPAVWRTCLLAMVLRSDSETIHLSVVTEVICYFDFFAGVSSHYTLGSSQEQDKKKISS